MGLAPTKQNTPPLAPTSAAPRPAAAPDKKLRRSQRIWLRIPLVAYSDKARSQPHPGFQETTLVVRVSAYGGLLEGCGPLQRGDRFMLRHVNRNEETECRVVYTKDGSPGKRLAGFEFTAGLVNFWGMSFPPISKA